MTESLISVQAGLQRLGLRHHPRVRLQPPPALEGPDFHLEIKFRDAGELQQLLDELIRLAREGRKMEKKVYTIDRTQDQEIATVKLATMGRKIDTLTPAQVAYLTDFASGT